MPKKKRTVQSAFEELNPTESEINQAYDILIEYFKHKPKFSGDPIEKATQVISACKQGWPSCPKTFPQRLRTKMGLNGAGNLRNYGQAAGEKASYAAKLQNMLEEAESGLDLPAPNFNASDKLEEEIDAAGRRAFMDGLSRSDREFFADRERVYRKEFDFNSSADYSLLFEVISSELKTYKIRKMELDEFQKDTPDQMRLLNLSKMSQDAHTNLEKSLKSLGITREQRKDELDDSAGDISSISANLEKKKRAMEAREKLEAEEELSGIDRKWSRGDVYHVDGLPRPVHNRIPQEIDIDELLTDAGIGDDDLVEG